MLHDHKPERISPIPGVIFDNPMGVHLDPEIEEDERPAKDPSEDVHSGRVTRGEMEIGPGEARIRDKVAVTDEPHDHAFEPRT